MTSLLGMTWSHPRGYDPMVATAERWRQQTGVEIVWEKRSLQDFEAYPVEELARRYDLIVIDHPHVGEVTDQNCLAPLDVAGREIEREALARASVGQSYASYTYAGHQWAFPIDAATQVMAFRPDLIDAPSSWDDVVDLAQQGKVTLPMLAPHSLMCLYTLSANLGQPCSTEKGEFIDLETGTRALEMLAAVTSHIDPSNFEMDPIAASEAMSTAETSPVVMPLGYGYVSYAMAGFRPHRLQFGNIPLPDSRGGALGGTGIAVSAYSKHAAEAIDYAYWVASGEVQAGLYAEAGGQPGHAQAWEADAVNAAAGDFYRGSRDTLERSYVRPRHHGYMAFQDVASKRLNAGLLDGEKPKVIIADLNRMFLESF